MLTLRGRSQQLLASGQRGVRVAGGWPCRSPGYADVACSCARRWGDVAASADPSLGFLLCYTHLPISALHSGPSPSASVQLQQTFGWNQVGNFRRVHSRKKGKKCVFRKGTPVEGSKSFSVCFFFLFVCLLPAYSSKQRQLLTTG